MLILFQCRPTLLVSREGNSYYLRYCCVFAVQRFDYACSDPVLAQEYEVSALVGTEMLILFSADLLYWCPADHACIEFCFGS